MRRVLKMYVFNKHCISFILQIYIFILLIFQKTDKRKHSSSEEESEKSDKEEKKKPVSIFSKYQR